MTTPTPSQALKALVEQWRTADCKRASTGIADVEALRPGVALAEKRCAEALAALIPAVEADEEKLKSYEDRSPDGDGHGMTGPDPVSDSAFARCSHDAGTAKSSGVTTAAKAERNSPKAGAGSEPADPHPQENARLITSLAESDDTGTDLEGSAGKPLARPSALSATSSRHNDSAKNLVRDAARPAPVEGWQPIATAPKGRIVLVHDEGYVGKGVYEDGDWIDAEEGSAKFDPAPTEWMPLPAPPPAVRTQEDR